MSQVLRLEFDLLQRVAEWPPKVFGHAQRPAKMFGAGALILDFLHPDADGSSGVGVLNRPDFPIPSTL